MLFYFAHSRDFDYNAELYEPLLKADIGDHEIILPAHPSVQPLNLREAIKQSDILFADLAHPSAELGLQIGWANASYIPVVAMIHPGESLPESIESICQYTLRYTDSTDYVRQLQRFLSKVDFGPEVDLADSSDE